MLPSSKIFIAGHRGLVGSALVRKIKEKGITSHLLKNRSELDLTNQII
jgi:GDP-L-fucose synthase